MDTTLVILILFMVNNFLWMLFYLLTRPRRSLNMPQLFPTSLRNAKGQPVNPNAMEDIENMPGHAADVLSQMNNDNTTTT